MSGRVILVGAGPGDPGLITARGLEALAAADVVVYDHLANADLLAHAPMAEHIDVGKRPGAHRHSQEEINALLAARAATGQTVVRLKGGDPYLFGRGGEEAAWLRAHGVSFAVVAGIPAALGMAACAGLPLTDRELASQVTFVTGHEAPGKDAPAVDWAALARLPGTLVVYMGVRNLPTITAALVAGGMASARPVAIVQQATTPAQRTLVGTLADIAEQAAAAGIEAPALLVVGEIVGRREQLCWFEDLPLFGRRIVVTRPADQAEALARPLRERGAEVILAPAIAIRPVDTPRHLDAALAMLGQQEWVVFTSANGVRHSWERLRAAGGDARAFAGTRLAAIGPATAEALARCGLAADLVADPHNSDALAAALMARGVAGKRLLLLRSDLADPTLAHRLAGAGADVREAVAYRTVPAAPVTDLLSAPLDAITFTSASTVRCLDQACGSGWLAANAARFAAVAIGPPTAAALRELGVEPAAVAEPHTVAGLVAALETLLRSPA